MKNTPLAQGVDVFRWRFFCVVACTLLVAASVAAEGTIARVGLIVPHIRRYLAGTDHSYKWCSEPTSVSSVSPATSITKGA